MFTQLIRPLLISGVSVLAMASTAFADLTHRDHVSIETDYVRASDLFMGADEVGDMILMEAPLPGRKKSITASQLKRFAAKTGLSWEKPEYLSRVTVAREGLQVSTDILQTLIHDAAIEAGINPDDRVTLFGAKNGIILPTDASYADIEIQDLFIDSSGRRLTATVAYPLGKGQEKRVNISGRVEAMQYVPMLVNAIAPGQVISANDIQWKAVPAQRVSRNAVTNEETLIGKTVSRPLVPGRLIRENDVKKPIAVKKGTYVAMTFSIGGLNLTAAGRALEDGGMGEVIRLMNTQSKNTVEAQIIAHDKVRILTGPQLFASN